MAKRKIKIDFWTSVTIVIAAVFILFLIYPLFSLFITGFQNPETGEFTMENFARFFRKKYYYQTLFNSLKVALSVTCIAILLWSIL